MALAPGAGPRMYNLRCGGLVVVTNEWMISATCVNISECLRHECTGEAKQQCCGVGFQSGTSITPK